MKTRRGWLWIGFALPLAIAAVETNEVQTVKVYPLDPKNAAVLATVRALAGNDGTVTPDPAKSRVLVVTTAARHAQINQAVANQVIVSRKVQLDVSMWQESRPLAKDDPPAGVRAMHMEIDRLHPDTLRIHPIDHAGMTSSNTVKKLTAESGQEARR